MQKHGAILGAMTPHQQLEKFLAKYDRRIAAMAKKALGKMRKLLPGANELVYDNYNALVIGFAPGDRPSDAVFSIALYPAHANLFFLQGRGCRTQRLRGSGTRVRSVRLDSASTLEERQIRDLIRLALLRAKAPFDANQKGQMTIRAVAKKQRPRRPTN
jgi:hypothetical protein